MKNMWHLQMTSTIKEIKTWDFEVSFMLNEIYSVGPAFGKWCCMDVDCIKVKV
jgi:hypothetical protein